VTHDRWRAVLGAVAIGAIVAGCGGGGVTGPSMTSGAAQQLGTDVAAVHAAVASGDRSQAVQALATLQSAVASLRRQGQVTATKAAAILGAAVEVEAQLGFMPTTTTTTTTSTTTTTTTAPRKGPKDKGGNGGGD
jgi:hypothetical protein